MSTITVGTPVPSLLRRESLTDQTARAVREAILDGTFALGQKIRESELVTRFGVSSSVIREALHILQGEGIVVTRPYCGRSIFSVQPEQIAELTTIRASLESYAAYLAAKKMTPDVAETITSAAERFLTDEPKTYSDWIDRETAFHRAVWDASQNDWLVRQLAQFSFPIFAIRMLGVGQRGSDVPTLWRKFLDWETPDNPKGHQSVARAIVGGDPREARRLMLVHILGAEPDLEQRDLFAM